MVGLLTPQRWENGRCRPCRCVMILARVTGPENWVYVPEPRNYISVVLKASRVCARLTA